MYSTGPFVSNRVPGAVRGLVGAGGSWGGGVLQASVQMILFSLELRQKCATQLIHLRLLSSGLLISP